MTGKGQRTEGKNLCYIPNRKRSNVGRRNETNVICFLVREMAQVISVYIAMQINQVLVRILRQ